MHGTMEKWRYVLLLERIACVAYSCGHSSAMLS